MLEKLFGNGQHHEALHVTLEEVELGPGWVESQMHGVSKGCSGELDLQKWERFYHTAISWYSLSCHDGGLVLEEEEH
jgi:hypothetical protein